MFHGHLGTSQSKKPGDFHRLPVLTGHAIYQRLTGKSTGIFILLRLFCEDLHPCPAHCHLQIYRKMTILTEKQRYPSFILTYGQLQFDIQIDLVYFLMTQ
jgi:hypothetical protein